MDAMMDPGHRPPRPGHGTGGEAHVRLCLGMAASPVGGPTGRPRGEASRLTRLSHDGTVTTEAARSRR